MNATALLDDLNITTINLDRLEASPIDWAVYFQRDEILVAPPKELRPLQQDSLNAVRDGLADADRGKLIMACGTGKTFTGLKIAEDLVGAGGTVLVLVPSLALMSQTIREWTIDSQTPLRSFAVCSDAQVGKRRAGWGGCRRKLTTISLASRASIRSALRPSNTQPDRVAVSLRSFNN